MSKLLNCVIASTLIAMAAPGRALASNADVVQPNDNRHAGGRLENGTLTLALRAAAGDWQPEGAHGPTLRVEAFGEIDGPLTVPAPLLRVTEGTSIVAIVRNDLDAALTVHGLCTRDGSACPPLTVPPRETRQLRFASGRPGTYHYWASSIGAPMPFREMAGAFVVDAAGAPPEPDRVLVITEWTNLTGEELGRIMTSDVPTETFVALDPRVTFVINGLSWPATERFTYARGERVRWRVLNLSSQPHPLHLHGFYFDVASMGNGLIDMPPGDTQPRRVVTQLLPPGATMAMTWVPERVGNWLFHCHVMHHVAPTRRLAGSPEQHSGHQDAHGASGHGPTPHHTAAAGMAGMIIGVTVVDELNEHAATAAPVTAGTATAGMTMAGPAAADSRLPRTHGADRATPAPAPTATRKLTLTLDEGSPAASGSPVAGFILTEGSAPEGTGRLSSPGPTLALRRQEPVEITVVNRLAEGTALHWHGIELDSYYDGVHGFSGVGPRVTPMLEPDTSFVVRFTPPRAGTFIYHTHLHDYRQLSSGLYGAIVVLDEDEVFNPEIDHVVVLGRTGVGSDAQSILITPETVVMNGERSPRFVWKAGVRHRVRLINITTDDIFAVSLRAGGSLASWKPLAKDGAPLPAAGTTARPAEQVIAVGETYDFGFEAPPQRGTAWLEVRTIGGKWLVQGQVIVK